jgi:hypothetical protein
VFLRFSVTFVLGGESQQGSLSHVLGYSVKAHCIGKPAYLEPTIQSLQKTVEGVYRIRVFNYQWHVRNARRVYLEPISGSMQKPVEGLLGIRCSLLIL